MSNSWIDSGDGTGIYCDADADNNLLQLKLKKPKAWKWELTTSRSSPNIALPRIMLFNHKGKLLVDANQQVDDAVYRAEKPLRSPKASKRRSKRLLRAATTNLEKSLQDDEDTGLGSLDSAEKHSYRQLNKTDSTLSKDKRMNNINFPGVEKVNGCKAWRNSMPDEIDFGCLQICEATDSEPSSSKKDFADEKKKNDKELEENVNIDTPWKRKWSQKEKHIEPPRLNKNALLNNSRDLAFPADIHDGSLDRLYVAKAAWKPFHSSGHLNAPPPAAQPFERRASSFKEVRFNVHPPSDDEQRKPKEKRRYKRSNTSERSSLAPSGSILERLSAMKCRFSSPELDVAETHQVQMGPRYFLRTSRAGTIVVAEETFKQRRVRRRPPKTSSTENVLSPSGSSLRGSQLPKQYGYLGANLGDPCTQSQSMNNFNELSGSHPRRKVIPIRRHRSDGNILLATSSDDDDQRSLNRSRCSERRGRSGSSRRNQGDAKNPIELGG